MEKLHLGSRRTGLTSKIGLFEDLKTLEAVISNETSMNLETAELPKAAAILIQLVRSIGNPARFLTISDYVQRFERCVRYPM